MLVAVGYPSVEEEAQMLRSIGSQHPIDDLQPLSSGNNVQQLQRQIDAVHVSDQVLGYLLRLIVATRQHMELALGASPRASIALHRAAQAAAALAGRHFVVPDDVKRLVVPVLRHRLVLRPESALRGRTAHDVLETILTAVPIDVENV
jgi:MoxR-like ATPase